MNERRYNALRKKVERLKRDADRAEGAHDELMSRLEEEFGVTELSEAENKLAELELELQQAEREFNKKLAEFERLVEDV